MSEKYKYVKYEFKEDTGIGAITINRPDKLNALNYPLIMEIVDVLENGGKNENIRVITIEGSGNCFSSGDDLKNMGPDGFKFNPLEDGSQLPHQRMLNMIRNVPKPVIALLHGYCLGAGFELALACDIRLASDNLEIGDHRSNRAICVLCGASYFLPRLVGFGRATEIIFSGRHLEAKEALEIGLVNYIYPANEFKKKAGEYVQNMANLPTTCLGYDKNMLNFSEYNQLIPSLQHELKLFTKNMRTQDSREGMKSFLERRKPTYIGK
jgi:2-(1,2-epoxy-1,2-dihydrophenyl)acetyl-CoA isomerase